MFRAGEKRKLDGVNACESWCRGVCLCVSPSGCNIVRARGGWCVFPLCCYCLNIIAKLKRRFCMTHAPWQSCLAEPDTQWLPTLSLSLNETHFLHINFPFSIDAISITFPWVYKRRAPRHWFCFPELQKAKAPLFFIHKTPYPCKWTELLIHAHMESTLNRKTNMHKSGLQSIFSKCSNSRTTLVNGISAPIPLEGFRNVFCLWAAN